MSKAMNKVLTMGLIIGLVMAGIIFFSGAMAATDENIDMSGSDYEGTYNTTTIIAIQSISMMNVVLLIVGVMAVVIGIKTFGNL